MRLVVGVEAIADQHGLDLRAERCEMLCPHRRPTPEGLLAVRPRRSREDRDTRPPTPARREQARIDLVHRGQEFAGPDERDGAPSRHAREHIRACATLPGT